jgi:acyl carrier protein
MLNEPREQFADAAFRQEIAEMIVEVLVLDDVSAGDIKPDEPLFGDGLGLDSIDALELSFAIAQRYGIRLRSDDERNREIFSSLDALSRHVAAHRIQ